MGKEDTDAASALISQMKSEGVTFLDHTSIDEVIYSEEAGYKLRYSRKHDDSKSSAGVFQADAVLVAAGGCSVITPQYVSIRILTLCASRGGKWRPIT